MQAIDAENKRMGDDACKHGSMKSDMLWLHIQNRIGVLNAQQTAIGPNMI